jgi:hypothetical protein
MIMSQITSDLTAAGSATQAVATDQTAVAAAQASLNSLSQQLTADQTTAQAAVTQLLQDLAAAGYNVAPPAATN